MKREIAQRNHQYIVGIDEVGRGPIAGPVAVGVLRISADNLARLRKARAFAGLRDSKQLSPKQRAVWFARVKDWRDSDTLTFAVRFVSAAQIDARGISLAIKKAMAAGLRALKVTGKRELVLLDGGLRAPAHILHQKTIIKGDEKEVVIALASIAAKEVRDAHMRRLAKRYSGYGFEQHAGYGTAGHYAALREKGLTPEHRRTFLKTLHL